MFIPKKILYTVGGVMIFLIGIFIGLSFGNGIGNGKIQPLPEQVAAVSDADKADLVVTDTAKTSIEPRLSELVKVIRVVDGDTVNVEISGKTESVRYIGIDTPETVDPRKPVQCFGVEALKKNKELVEGKMVRLEKDITDRDKYNRLLRYVWLGSLLINQELVEQGFAKSYSYPPDVKYQNKFMETEKKARGNKLGLWTACSPEVTPATAAMSTTALPAVQASSENLSCTIKGNISASGEKIYHMQGCDSYTKTIIEENRGEQWFCTEAEAQSAGWRKALNC